MEPNFMTYEVYEGSRGNPDYMEASHCLVTVSSRLFYWASDELWVCYDRLQEKCLEGKQALKGDEINLHHDRIELLVVWHWFFPKLWQAFLEMNEYVT